MFRALWSSSKPNDDHSSSARSSTTTTNATIASENASATYHDAASRKHATDVKTELSYAGDHIQSAATHASASISHAIAEKKASMKAEALEKQKQAEIEKKKQLEDSYRTPKYNALAGHYNEIFKMKPFVNHQLSVHTPDIINTKGVNYCGWQWIPTLGFGVGVSPSQPRYPALTESVTIDSTLAGSRGNKSSFTDFSIGAPIADPSNAFMYSSTKVENGDNGAGVDYYSILDQNLASVGIGFRLGPQSPSLGLNWWMSNNDISGEKNHQLSIDSSHCFYRNPQLNESFTGGFRALTKPMISCKTMDHRSIESIGAAFRYSMENDQLSAAIKIDPYTAKVQAGEMQISTTQRMSSTTEFPQYSIGLRAGMIALNPLTDRSQERFTKANFDTDTIFTSPLVSKPLLIADFLYRPSSLLRYRARMTSDFGVCLMYQHTINNNMQIQACISNGVKGINGTAAQQGSIVEPVFAPTLAIGLNLDGNE